jgi:hypothetical protein
MIIEPDYGVEEEVKDKKFKIVFEDCINLSIRGLSKHDSSGIEFISWGKIEDKGRTIEFINGSTEIQGFGKFSSRVGNQIGDYDTYFFENVFGDIIYITCWTVSVTQL